MHCEQPDCRNLPLAGDRYCWRHKRTARKRRKKVTAPVYRTEAHRRWAAAVKARNPYYVDPYKRHRRPVPARIADRIIPLSEGGRYTMENGQGLCWSCHETKKVRERRKKEQGW